ncbi:MAG: peptidase M24 [Acidobacteria bacterium]|nr:MAG: peptidase M24 [Acidobacteriota bacterium]
MTHGEEPYDFDPRRMSRRFPRKKIVSRIHMTAYLLMALGGVAGAQDRRPEFTKVFSKEEFARRREKLCTAIGSNAVAVLRGNEGMPGYVTFRQGNDFFYLSGVEAPGAMLLLDGATRETTLFLPPKNEPRQRSEGPLLVPDEYGRQVTGIARVVNVETFTETLQRLVGSHDTLYTPTAPQELEAMSRDLAVRYNNERINDPWDGRSSREAHFIALLHERFPALSIKDLSPELDRMRSIKSPEEISVIRKSSELAALAIAEAMRSTLPGQYEYELNALTRFIHLQNGAQGAAYYALIASARNAIMPHYHAGSRQMQDGDLLLVDFAPDYHYYQADVTRMWPVNGKFSPDQRELYTFYLKCYQSIMKHIRSNVTPRLIAQEALADMEAALRETSFSKDKYRKGAENFVAAYRRNVEGSGPSRLGHFVGLATHDVGPAPEVLKPGMVFTIEPALTVPEDEIYIRLEDMLLVTDQGVENLSAMVPVEIDRIEALMKEPGILKRNPRKVPEDAVRPKAGGVQ